MSNNEKLPIMKQRPTTINFNDSHQIKSLISDNFTAKRPQSLHPNHKTKDPLMQTNSFWVEKSIQLPNFTHTSCAKYNIINHTSNHKFFVNNVAKNKAATHRKKAITEFCDYQKVSVPSINKAYQVG